MGDLGAPASAQIRDSRGLIGSTEIAAVGASVMTSASRIDPTEETGHRQSGLT
jgi:hypothetical protein